MTRIRSGITRQAILVLDGVFDPANEPDRLALFDQDGNQLDFSPAHQIPPGGTAGQVLGKDSDTDFDVVWVDAGDGSGAVVPAGGFTGQVLVKASNADGDVEWGAGGGGGFNWQGPWESQVYEAGSVVRFNKGLWLATGDTLASDIPGTAESITWQDSMGDMPEEGVFLRLHPNEPLPFHVSSGGSMDTDWDFYFFDVITAGTLLVDKVPDISFAWMNMYFGSTGVRFSPNPGVSNYSDTLGVGRYMIVLVPNGGTTRDGTIEVIPGTAEISEGSVNPWELIIMGSQSYVYDE